MNEFRTYTFRLLKCDNVSVLDFRGGTAWKSLFAWLWYLNWVWRCGKYSQGRGQVLHILYNIAEIYKVMVSIWMQIFFKFSI